MPKRSGPLERGLRLKHVPAPRCRACIRDGRRKRVRLQTSFQISNRRPELKPQTLFAVLVGVDSTMNPEFRPSANTHRPQKNRTCLRPSPDGTIEGRSELFPRRCGALRVRHTFFLAVAQLRL